jgi:hypothetical protein
MPILLVMALLLTACSGPGTAPATIPKTSSQYPTNARATGTKSPVATEQTQPEASSKPLPLSPATTRRTPPPTATQSPEYRWDQLLGRDDIKPIYEPEFVSAAEAGFADGELVMGVEIDGRAKAYPVGLLNEREMVNDELAGIPILVTW